MPTVIPAASVRPKPSSKTASSRRRRLLAIALAMSVAASFAFTQPPAVAASARPDCSGWHSLTQPPRTIRVLRQHQGRIQTVDFRKYVVTVMGKEWPSYLPDPVIAAGAVAVKQYAWYHAVYSSRSYKGRCFDVKDGTDDQLFKPHKSRVRQPHYNAIAATWGVTLRKNGRFFMTGYRRGDKVRCGHDHTGYKLYARSAIQCARNGMGWREILGTYYGPNLELVDGGQPLTTAQQAAPASRSSEVRSPGSAAAAGQRARPKAVPLYPSSGSAGGATGGVDAILRQQPETLIVL